MISQMRKDLMVNGTMMRVYFAVRFDDQGVLDHLASKAAHSSTGKAHDCDGAIEVTVLSMARLDSAK